MKKRSKPVRFGRFVFTKIADEYVYIYSGSKKVYVKTVRLSKPGSGMIFKSVKSIFKAFSGFFTFKKAFAVGISVFLLIVAGSLYNRTTPFLPEDEDKKLKLLQASDYVAPDETRSLEIREHVVQRGETLSHIAREYGVSMDTICGSNNLTSYDWIREGTRLKIPSKDGMLYEMEEGARLVKIAQKYEVSLESILQENDFQNPDFIATNTVLFIPDAKPKNIIRGFMWPTSTRLVSSGYGWRRNPFDRRSRQFHQGIDIRARYSWIRSAMYGRVTYAGWLGGYGNTIIVAHPGGYRTLYAHLSRINVREGQHVRQGQIIARSGNTGRSTGPHLHFEIRKNGRHINPYTKLQR